MLKGLILSLCAAVFCVGCTTRASQHWVETLIDQQGHKSQIVKRILYPANSSWDKPAVKDTIYQVCPIDAYDRKTDVLKTEDCVSEHDHANGMTYTRRAHDANGPLLSGVASSAIIAGGIVGGAAVLRPSRTTVNATANGGDNNAAFFDNIPPTGGHKLVK